MIHPKDIPDLQFDRKTRNKGEISPDTEISMIEVNITSDRDEYSEIPPKQLPIKVSSDPSADKEKSVDILDLCEERVSSRQKFEIGYKIKCLISVNSTLQGQWKNV